MKGHLCIYVFWQDRLDALPGQIVNRLLFHQGFQSEPGLDDDYHHAPLHPQPVELGGLGASTMNSLDTPLLPAETPTLPVSGSQATSGRENVPVVDPDYEPHADCDSDIIPQFEQNSSSSMARC